jgi:hypothetical protein
VLPLSTKFLVFLFLYDKSDCNDNGASRMMKASDGIHSGGGFGGFLLEHFYLSKSFCGTLSKSSIVMQ